MMTKSITHTIMRILEKCSKTPTVIAIRKVLADESTLSR